MSEYLLKVPVLILIFNRLETTKQVFESIRKSKPYKIYIAADGARSDKPDEDVKVKAVRDYVMNNIDWNCEVKTLFREKNLGCGPNVKTSIDWFFENEDMGIILEDDTCPTHSFFRYCEELLIKYHSDDRIGMISGNNHLGYMPDDDSYLFSRYKGCWGWASWRRAWKNMDFDMEWFNSWQKDIIIRNMGHSNVSVNHWRNCVKLLKTKSVNTWDWQWYFSLAAQGQLCIIPKCNLVENIGFGDDATHTFGTPDKSYVETGEIEFPLRHPQYIIDNYKYNERFENVLLKSNFLKRIIPHRVKKILKILLIKK